MERYRIQPDAAVYFVTFAIVDGRGSSAARYLSDGREVVEVPLAAIAW
jgi:hypothetical protein